MYMLFTLNNSSSLECSSLRRTSLETPECVSGHLDAVIDPDLRVDETQTASDSCCLAAGDEEGDVSSQGENSERERNVCM